MSMDSRLLFLAMACAAAALLAGGVAGMSCGDAVNALIPCGSYLVGNGPEDPGPQCCASAKALNKMATTKELRRQLCECFESTGPSFGVVPRRVLHLPSFCKLKLGIALDPHTNCSRV